MTTKTVKGMSILSTLSISALVLASSVIFSGANAATVTGSTNATVPGTQLAWWAAGNPYRGYGYYRGGPRYYGAWGNGYYRPVYNGRAVTTRCWVKPNGVRVCTRRAY